MDPGGIGWKPLPVGGRVTGGLSATAGRNGTRLTVGVSGCGGKIPADRITGAGEIMIVFATLMQQLRQTEFSRAQGSAR